MSTTTDLEAIKATVAHLDPRATAAEVSLTVGARIKGWSAERVGGRSADTPLPMFDDEDRATLAKDKAYRQAIAAARRSLDSALRIQRDLLTRISPEDAAKLVEAEELGVECANCHRVVGCHSKDKLLSGRCRACHEYRRDHQGTERPRDLWEAA